MKYPIYVISKGRHDCNFTANFLLRDKVDFKIVVEPQEKILYAEKYGEERLEILPFSDLGKGSIPARNWCWENSIKNGHEKHWILDDNMRGVGRWNLGKRIPCNSKFAFLSVEEFSDRYENLAITGLDYECFCVGNMDKPFVLNSRVYSFMLIKNDLDVRWRGRYNEDTDLCLQVLAKKQCTALFRAFYTQKMRTMIMKGGNSDVLYKGDGRIKMSRSLERVWPLVTETKRKFKRPQHKVRDNWRKFDTKLIFKKDFDKNKLKQKNEFGMELKEISEVKSPTLKKWFDEVKKKDD